MALRYFNVFGPNQDSTSQYSAVIPNFIKPMREDKELINYGDGTQSRDFTFVENVVFANILACNAEKAAGEIINIAYGESYNLLELLKMINEILGKNIEHRFAPERPGDVKHSLANIDKANEFLDDEIKVDFKEELKRTIEFFLCLNYYYM